MRALCTPVCAVKIKERRRGLTSHVAGGRGGQRGRHGDAVALHRPQQLHRGRGLAPAERLAGAVRELRGNMLSHHAYLGAAYAEVDPYT